MAGGSVAGGWVAGGSVDGGSVAGGCVAGGSVDGGSVAGGWVAGGSVEGGSVEGCVVVSGGSVFVDSVSEGRGVEDSEAEDPSVSDGWVLSGTVVPQAARERDRIISNAVRVRFIRSLFLSKIQLGCEIAVDIVAHGFFHKAFRDTKSFGKLVDGGAAIGYGIIQGGFRDQVEDSPFICPVFVALPAIDSGVTVIKAAGDAMAQLVGQLHSFVILGVKFVGIDCNIAEPLIVHHGYGFPLLQVKAVYLDILFIRNLVEL